MAVSGGGMRALLLAMALLNVCLVLHGMGMRSLRKVGAGTTASKAAVNSSGDRDRDSSSGGRGSGGERGEGGAAADVLDAQLPNQLLRPSREGPRQLPPSIGESKVASSLVAGGVVEKSETTRSAAPTSADEDARKLHAERDTCLEWKEKYGVEPSVSWGSMPDAIQGDWAKFFCDRFMPLASERAPPANCLDRPSQESDPLIAVMVGSTTRGLQNPSVNNMSLFVFMLPSLERTVECGFNYVAVVGYDAGDAFFDSQEASDKVTEWFKTNVGLPAHSRGISIELMLVRVENKLMKPGPVFASMAQASYQIGATFFYRLNDDTELVDPWAVKFTSALLAMGEPFGVVGPHSLENKSILVHDFTHRTHMDIFRGIYYPLELSDWYMDDWISTVYGNRRTIRAKNVLAIHHTSAHGRRYEADRAHKKFLRPLLNKGIQTIAGWMEAREQELRSPATAAAISAFVSDTFDGQSARSQRARNIE